MLGVGNLPHVSCVDRSRKSMSRLMVIGVGPIDIRLMVIGVGNRC